MRPIHLIIPGSVQNKIMSPSLTARIVDVCVFVLKLADDNARITEILRDIAKIVNFV